jgi:predicted Zn-dependent protease
MKYILFYAWLLCFAAAVGCDGRSSTSATAVDAEYDRQLKQAARQLEENDRLLQRGTEQNDRYDALLERWEHQADRMDRILERWERPEGQPPDGR